MKKDCPEFHGYNTKESRDQGHKEQVKRKAVCQPLVDTKPRDTDTMMTVMVRAPEPTADTGQTVHSSDL